MAIGKEGSVMKKIFIFLGVRTPILALLVTCLFFLILIYSANVYSVDRLVKLKVEVQEYSNDTVIFDLMENQDLLEVGNEIFLGYSQQTTFLKGKIIKISGEVYKAKIKDLEDVDFSQLNKDLAVIKIKDKKEPIIRRLID